MANVVEGKMADEVKVLRWEHVLDEIAARRAFHAYSDSMSSSADSVLSLEDDNEVKLAPPVVLPRRRVLDLVKVVARKFFDVINVKAALEEEEELHPDDQITAEQEIRKSVRDIARSFEAKVPPYCRSLPGFETAKRLELTEIRLREKHHEEQMRNHRCLAPAPAVPKVNGASLADETARFFAKNSKKIAPIPPQAHEEVATATSTTGMPVVILTYAIATAALAVWERTLAVAALHDGL